MHAEQYFAMIIFLQISNSIVADSCNNLVKFCRMRTTNVWIGSRRINFCMYDNIFFFNLFEHSYFEYQWFIDIFPSYCFRSWHCLFPTYEAIQLLFPMILFQCLIYRILIYPNANCLNWEPSIKVLLWLLLVAFGANLGLLNNQFIKLVHWYKYLYLCILFNFLATKLEN